MNAPRREFVAEPRPPAIDGLRRVHFDVREDIRSGREPFARIMSAVSSLADGETLVIRAPFEPLPLYRVLANRGFASWTERRDESDWSVWFYRTEPMKTAPAPARTRTDLTLDVRGLEPPQPMVAVLEHLDTLVPGQTLVVIHDRRPMFLYPQLDDRGFEHQTEEPEPGIVRIRIRRDDPSRGRRDD
jgi:uncharacterized protein (DUF2249 family)